METLSAIRFLMRVDSAMAEVRRLLDQQRTPELPAQIDHTYSDKFQLVEFLVRAAIRSFFETFVASGLQQLDVPKLLDGASKRSLTLRFSAVEHCEYVRKVTSQVSSQASSSARSIFGLSESYTVRDIEEHVWLFRVSYVLSAVSGTDFAQPLLELKRGYGELLVRTASEQMPRPSVCVREPLDLDITWMLRQAPTSASPLGFRIDRQRHTCRTPRRNEETAEALDAFRRLWAWRSAVTDYIAVQLPHKQEQKQLIAAAAVDADPTFLPVLPLMESSKEGTSKLRLAI
jgi:hypothetical protein